MPCLGGLRSSNFNDIFILGAGAIGSIYGAFLSRKHRVTLIANKEHAEAINSTGLRITGDIDETFHLKANTEIHEIRSKTLVILTTKAYDSERAINGIKELLKEDTVILILQNGLGNDEIVRHVVGDRVEVLRGVIKMAAESSKPGEIKFWNGETIIEANKAATRIVEILGESGLEARLSEHFERDLWNKLAVNCVVNPLTALFRVKNCAIWADSLKSIRHGIVKECIEVAGAEGISLRSDLAERIDERVASYTNFSSMHQDIVRGKRTEIDFLNGKIVALGKKHGIQTPINATITSLIKFLEGKNGIPTKD